MRVQTILGLAYLVILILMLEFGTIQGEGKVIDVVIDGLVTIIRN